MIFHLRNLFSVEKMTMESPGDTVIYRSRLNRKINRNFEVFTPTDFLAAITQHCGKSELRSASVESKWEKPRRPSFSEFVIRHSSGVPAHGVKRSPFHPSATIGGGLRAVKRHRTGQSAEKAENALALRQTGAENRRNEPDGKAILREPRSVKRQFPIS